MGVRYSLILWVLMKWVEIIFVRVVYGTRISLLVGVFASCIVVLIGVIYGSVSGYFGGKGRLGHDANSGYYLFPAGYADDYLLSVVLRETLNLDAIPALSSWVQI